MCPAYREVKAVGSCFLVFYQRVIVSSQRHDLTVACKEQSELLFSGCFLFPVMGFDLSLLYRDQYTGSDTRESSWRVSRTNEKLLTGNAEHARMCNRGKLVEVVTVTRLKMAGATGRKIAMQ